MSTGREFRIDAWSWLSHKAAVGDGTRRTPVGEVPSWVPEEDRRRLEAYRVYVEYRTNCVGRELQAPVDSKYTAEQLRAAHREYGDAALLIDRVAHGVHGEDWEIEVVGADDDLAAGPVLPEEPEAPGEGAPEVERRLYQVRLERWTSEVEEITEEWIAEFEGQPNLRRVQDELRDWAEQVGFAGKLVEAEKECVTTGDVVWALWPQPDGWPRLQVYEPNAYFPHLSTNDLEYPDVVDLAWEEEGPPDSNNVRERFVRRMRWKLVDLTTMRVLETPNGPMFGALMEGEVVTGEGQVVRQVPYSDEPVTTTCIYSMGLWTLDQVGPAGIPDLSEGAAREFEEVDLLCDFIPLVHIPNTPASREHYGQSCLASVAQVLDDVGQADTDLMEALRLTTGPAIALSGAQSDDQDIQPLAIFNLGPEGQMTVLDLSTGMQIAMAGRESLIDRLLINASIPRSMVGRVDSSDAPSGIAMLIDAAPFAALIGTLRMSRDPKYSLLLKFAQRLAMVAGVLDAGEVPKARVAFGSFLPLDRGQVVTETVEAYAANLLSLRTALRNLKSADAFPIDDVDDEAAQIEAEDLEGARLMADATGSEQVAADRLGVELPEQPQPPEITLPEPPPQLPL